MRRDPFFVVGYPRSGTTLLASLLDRHPMIAMTPETAFFGELYEDLSRKIRMGVSGHDLIAASLAHRKFKDLNLDVAAVAPLCDAGIGTPAVIFHAALKAYLANRDKDIVGEKSPIHTYYVDRIRKAYLSAKFIWLLRDGRDAVSSMMKVPWSNKNIARLSAEWAYCEKLLTRHKHELGSDLHIVRFEELVTNKKVVLSDICRHLDVPFSPDMLESNKKSNVVPDWEKAWKEKAQTPVDSSRVGAWKRDADAHSLAVMTQVMGRALERLDYESPAQESLEKLAAHESAFLKCVYSEATYPKLRAGWKAVKRSVPLLG